eukprot:g16382.t3
MEDIPSQPEPVAQLDLLCIAGGMGCWYFAKEQLGEAWALTIRAKRAWPVQLLGAALMASSVSLRRRAVGLVTCAVDRFRAQGTPLSHRQASQVLVMDGPFEWSRNPMYLSMLGNISSVGLMANTWWGLLALLPFAAYLQFCIIPGEEAYLRARFKGLLTIIICKTFNLIMGYADGVYRDRLYFAKDYAKALRSLASCRPCRCCKLPTKNIRTLRMLAWTSSYERVISRARAEELRMAWIRLWLQKMPAALDYGLSTLVTLVTLGFYVHTTHEQLKASLALPVIALIGSLIGSIGQFPVLVKEYKVFRSAYDRFHRFMGFGHQPKPFEPESARSPTSSPAALNLEDCSFQWVAATASSEDGTCENR